jgi:predicted 2-oxoglutarate/Fe(II)-dependent dioxygenase YbiX
MPTPPFYNPSVYEQIRVLSKHLLEEDVCDKLIKNYDTDLELKNQDGDNNVSYRSVKIKDIDINEIPGLRDQVLSANFEYYRLNVNALKSDCFFAKYETGMHYQELHMDCVPGDHQRKITFTLMLNDDFEGGQFELLGNTYIEKERGKLLVLPSFLPHRITQVTSGVRYAIFGWFYGPNFI